MAEAQVSRVAALAEVEDWGGRGERRLYRRQQKKFCKLSSSGSATPSTKRLCTVKLVNQEYEMDVDDVEIAGRQASGFNPMREKKEDGVK